MEYVDYLGENFTDTYDDMNDFLNINLKSEQIWEYHKKTVMQGKCSAYIPVRYVENSDYTDLFYDLEGATSLYSFIHDKDTETESVLSMILSIVEAVREAGKYLFYDEEIEISLEKVFIDKGTGTVKFIYDPRVRTDKSIFTRIKEMIKTVASDDTLTDELRTALYNYYGLISSGCRNTDDLEKMTKQYLLSIRSKDVQTEKTKGFKGSDYKGARGYKPKVIQEYKSKGVQDYKPKGAREIVKDAFIKLIT